jgi:PAS domain S-box-containing protein
LTLHDYDRIKDRLKLVADPVGFLTNLFAHAPVAFAVWTADGRALLTNQAFMDLFLVEPPPEYNVLEDEILAKNGMLAFFQRAFAGETVHVPTFWYDPRDLQTITVKEGRRVAISMTIFPLFKENGEIDHVAATYKDQTEIMVATEQLRISEERLRLAQQAAHVGSFEWNVQTGVNTWSPELEALYGLVPGEFASTQQNWEQLVHPEDRVAAISRVKQAFETFLPVEGEWRVCWPDGSLHWLVGRFQVLKDESGNPHRLIGVNMEITERKREEEALRQAEAGLKESEESLRITLNSIGDAVIATDAVGCVTRMNPVAEELTGWKLHQATGKKLSEVFPIRNEDTGEPIENPVDRILREGKVIGFANHTVLVSRDGSERAIADSGAPMRRASGETCGVVLVFRDVTRERRAEEALRHWERIFQHANWGVATASVDDVSFQAVNPTYARMHGYEVEDLLGAPVSTVWAPETRADMERHASKTHAHGQLVVETTHLRKDGTRLPVEVVATTIKDATGRVKWFVASVQDITERRRAQTALRESEARKRAVMEAALDAIVLMDYEGKIVEFNPAAERTFGYSRNEVVGKSLADVLVPPALRSRHLAGLNRYLDTGEARIVGKRIELPAMRRDGTEFPAEIAVVRIGSEGDPVFTGYIRDITERKQAAEAEMLRREKEAAEEANAELEAFSYSVAHDLRGPLRGMSGWSAVLLEDYGDRLDDTGKEYLDRIGASTGRMSQIIDALLSLARLTRTEVHRVPVDLTKLAQTVIGQLRATDRERSVDFVAEDGLGADGDPHLLRVVLDNLLGNAWKFTSKASPARIEFGRQTIQDMPTFFVRDNGAGFDMEHVGRLFAPFRRLHTSEEFEGTGIGLATVQRIVRRHGGRIWAEGAKNRGATFYFTLPSEISGRRSWLPAR